MVKHLNIASISYAPKALPAFPPGGLSGVQKVPGAHCETDLRRRVTPKCQKEPSSKSGYFNGKKLREKIS